MEENVIIAALKRSLNEGVMVSVYSSHIEPDKCSIGYIDLISSEHFIMKHVTPDGKSDGYIVRKIEDVFRVDFNGEYEKNLELLYRLQKQQHQQFVKNNKIEEINLFEETLIFAQKNNLVVTICIDETENQDDIVGFVKNINVQGVTISRISLNGLEDGETSVFIEHIIKIDCDTIDEKKYMLLFAHKKN